MSLSHAEQNILNEINQSIENDLIPKETFNMITTWLKSLNKSSGEAIHYAGFIGKIRWIIQGLPTLSDPNNQLFLLGVGREKKDAWERYSSVGKSYRYNGEDHKGAYDNAYRLNFMLLQSPDFPNYLPSAQETQSWQPLFDSFLLTIQIRILKLLEKHWQTRENYTNLVDYIFNQGIQDHPDFEEQLNFLKNQVQLKFSQLYDNKSYTDTIAFFLTYFHHEALQCNLIESLRQKLIEVENKATPISHASSSHSGLHFFSFNESQNDDIPPSQQRSSCMNLSLRR